MDKRTILAIVLSSLVMLVFFFIQGIMTTPLEPDGTPSPTEAVSLAAPQEQAPPPPPVQETLQAGPLAAAAETVPFERVIIETDLLRVALSNAGGDITSFQLKNHLDNGVPVEMILGGSGGTQAFSVAFGNRADVIARRVSPVDQHFRVNRTSAYGVEFSQDFRSPQGGIFTLSKRYEFAPGEYMFELVISLNGGHSMSYFDFEGAAYTLIYGPQIGPQFTRLDRRQEYRNYISYNGRVRNERVSEGNPAVLASNSSWGAIVGKYFALAALPFAGDAEMALASYSEPGLPGASRLFVTRPAFRGPRIEDRYLFYLGPKNQANLNLYERGDNAFRLRESGLIEVASTRGFLAPLENLLKWFLQIFYRIVPNYGIAIILLTILVKILMFPITRKGSESTLRMQALSPKIKELQEKYQDNRQKLNAEMAEFYKREGYNPISGCLPMLFQFPIFIAMFNLFNNHFDLRGAVFIPGWIPDLSVPEFIYEFPEGISVPIVGWTALRLLPVIYVASQLLYGKVTQTPDQQGNKQMKMMLYAMPIIFFFVLYDMPSGLLVYWIMSNILTMVQQVGINKVMARKKAALAAAAPPPPPVNAPRKNKKKG